MKQGVAGGVAPAGGTRRTKEQKEENKKKMMNRANQFRKYVAAGIACLALLAASCSDVTDDGTTLPAGEYPMTFTAQVDGLAVSRATTSSGTTTWVKDDLVAVSMDGGASHKEYKITDTSTGAMSPNRDTDIFYWNSTQETKTLAAWHPVNCNIGSGSSVDGVVSITDQSNGFETLESILYAPKDEYTYSSGGSVNLTFRHALAKVQATLKKESGKNDFTDEEISSATVSFMGYTTGTLGYDGMTGSGENGSILSKKEVSASSTTYTVLLIPQQMQGQPFIKVTIGTGTAARDYYYTPADASEVNLEAGKLHTYNITVKKTGLEVETITASWEGGDPIEEEASEAKFRITLPTGDGVPDGLEFSDNVTQIGSSNVYETQSGNSFTLTYTVPDGGSGKGFPVVKGLCDVNKAKNGDKYVFTYSNIRSDLWLEYADYTD